MHIVIIRECSITKKTKDNWIRQEEFSNSNARSLAIFLSKKCKTFGLVNCVCRVLSRMYKNKSTWRAFEEERCRSVFVWIRAYIFHLEQLSIPLDSTTQPGAKYSPVEISAHFHFLVATLTFSINPFPTFAVRPLHKPSKPQKGRDRIWNQKTLFYLFLRNRPETKSNPAVENMKVKRPQMCEKMWFFAIISFPHIACHFSPRIEEWIRKSVKLFMQIALGKDTCQRLFALFSFVERMAMQFGSGVSFTKWTCWLNAMKNYVNLLTEVWIVNCIHTLRTDLDKHDRSRTIDQQWTLGFRLYVYQD